MLSIFFLHYFLSFVLVFFLSSSIIVQVFGQQQQQEEEYAKKSLDVEESASDNIHFTIPTPISFIIKELENLLNNVEYTFDLDGKQIFPNDKIKQDIVSEYKASEYDINDLNYELLGFKITASDIKIQVNPTKIDDTKTRVNIPLLSVDDVKVTNGPINLSYNEVDLGSVYGIYDKNTDKMTVHVPVSIAAKYIQQ